MVDIADDINGGPHGRKRPLQVHGCGPAQVVVDRGQRHAGRGEKLFVDFPGETVPVWDRRTGEVAMGAELFVAVLGEAC